ncbi:MAG: aminopeptidase P family protein [Phycisphaerales bacterium]|nr:aminopeptidase P family protein [Phycisphaerales bacterium]
MNPTIMAGIPSHNLALYHRIRFLLGDPTVIIETDQGSTLLVRDIELDRARAHANADRCASPNDFEPEGGLSGDRETAFAQAATECLRRQGVTEVTADRSMPLLYWKILTDGGIRVVCDPEMRLLDRRRKDEHEIARLAEAQKATEDAMEMACRLVATASARADGTLEAEGVPLTSEVLRAEIDALLLRQGYSNTPSIVACGAQGADCHDRGTGPIRTGETVIIDIFPQNKTTLYNGDCTRTVVHGDIPDEVRALHETVLLAKRRAIEVVRTGATGEEVHLASVRTMTEAGYAMGPFTDDRAHMTHGTGHGIGLEVHEPPLLDVKGPALVRGDALTIEPGLYRQGLGGVRIEDMVIVTDEGSRNLNSLHEGLDWR